MILSLAYYGSKWLRTRADPVTVFDDKLKELIDDMIETMHVHRGIGLAATQVKLNKRIFITFVPRETEEEDEELVPQEPKVYINPKILSFSDEFIEWEEACLSLPGLSAFVPRPQSIDIEAYDQNGALFKETLTDFYACNFLHENDHLNGVLYIDRLANKDKERLKKPLHDLKEKYKKRH
ncbi:peptide deformylase [Criblamydia sequanensis]|uniref:Peptide deformylase n=1 Tax=Candidatus Criblamydia sequanensis CRIB-18 TaxID=1437425 RepID=A0A090D0T1_9BACT|nr:peptide deformylase [Criblamydia sequanensis]CDR33475.1 Peptide deformylase [Criblamydia sequanensis CRIB-18]